MLTVQTWSLGADNVRISILAVLICILTLYVGSINLAIEMIIAEYWLLYCAF